MPYSPAPVNIPPPFDPANTPNCPTDLLSTFVLFLAQHQPLWTDRANFGEIICES